MLGAMNSWAGAIGGLLCLGGGGHGVLRHGQLLCRHRHRASARAAKARIAQESSNRSKIGTKTKTLQRVTLTLQIRQSTVPKKYKVLFFQDRVAPTEGRQRTGLALSVLCAPQSDNNIYFLSDRRTCVDAPPGPSHRQGDDGAHARSRRGGGGYVNAAPLAE